MARGGHSCHFQAGQPHGPRRCGGPEHSVGVSKAVSRLPRPVSPFQRELATVYRYRFVAVMLKILRFMDFAIDVGRIGFLNKSLP